MQEPDALLRELTARDAWMQALARHLVRGEDAADLAQEAWLKALESPPSDSAALRPWLRRVMRGLAKRWRTSSEHRRAREAATARSESTPSTEEVLDRETTRYIVAQAVRGLDEPYRTAIVCRYFEGLAPREIAARVGASPVAVESRLKRGLQKLRARLERDLGGRVACGGALTRLAADTVAAAASASVMSGAIVISTKTKIAGALAVALTAAVALWPDNPPSPPAPVVAEKPTPRGAEAESHTDDRPAEQASPDATSSTPTAHPHVATTIAPRRIVGCVRDAAGTPIAGATVSALYLRRLTVTLPTMRSTTTDERGNYALEPIDARCVVQAAATQHCTERRQVDPGSRADFNLGAPATIGGTVKAVSSGLGCAGVTVVAYDWQPPHDHTRGQWLNTWRAPPVATTSTDASGQYAFECLRPGQYTLWFLSAEHVDRCLTGPIVADAAHVRVTDVWLADGDTMSGTVSDADTGAPIAGARVHVRPEEHIEATTDAHGRFVIRGIDPKLQQRRIRVVAAGYVPQRESYYDMAYEREQRVDIRMHRGVLIAGTVRAEDGSPLPGARVSTTKMVTYPPDLRALHAREMAVAHSDETGQYRLRVTRRDKPRVIHAAKDGYGVGCTEPFAIPPNEDMAEADVQVVRGGAIVGRVTQPSGSPVAGARVTVFRDRLHCVGQAFTRADGTYGIGGIPCGECAVHVVPGAELPVVASALVGRVMARIDVRPAETTKLDVALALGARLDGRVIDDNGRGIEGALVRAHPSRQQIHLGACYGQAPAMRTTRTDADGHFTILGLRDDPRRPYHLIWAEKEGYAYGRLWSIAPGRTDLTVTLDRLARVTGQVVDGTSGEPVARATVRAFSGEGKSARVARADVVDPEGRFSLFTRPGTCVLNAFGRDGNVADRVVVDASIEHDANSVRLTLWPGATLEGTVRSSTGAAARWGTVTVRDTSGRWVVSAVVRDGRFRLPSVPTGDLVVTARARLDADHDYEGLVRLRTAAGGRHDASIVVSDGTRVQIEVRGSDDRPIEGARVAVRHADLDHTLALTLTYSRMKLPFIPIDFPTTEANGRIFPVWLLQSRYTVEVTAPGYRSKRIGLDVDGDAPMSRIIRLDRH